MPSPITWWSNRPVASFWCLVVACWLGGLRTEVVAVEPDSFCVDGPTILAVAASSKQGTQECAALLGQAHAGRSVCSELQFAESSLKDPEIFAAVLSCLHGRPEITELDLSGHFIRRESGEALGATLASLPNVTKIDLSNNALGQRGVETVVFAIMRHPRIQSLSFAKNFLDSKVVKDALSFLFIFSPSLETLDLSDNRIDDGFSGSLLSSMSNNKHGRLRLKNLSCARCRLGAKSWKELAHLVALNQPDFDGHLDLSGNNAGPQGARVLFAALRNNTHISQLSLANNRLQDEGALEFSTAIHGLMRIKRLDLSENYIGDAGAASVAQAILESQLRLTELKMEKNAIGDTGAAALQKLFHKLAGVGPQPGIVLQDGDIGAATGPFTLELFGNEFSSAAVNNMTAVFKRSWTRYKLVLHLCGTGSRNINAKDCDELREAHRLRERFRQNIEAPWLPLPFVLVIVSSVVVLVVASAGHQWLPANTVTVAGVTTTAAMCSIATMAITKSTAFASDIGIGDSETSVIAAAALNALLVLGVALTAAGRRR
eukprot:INCI12191.2.p1 GENE.INCI12191.2~~INCI12191.2.p1  ORF type:complete len:583 (-),score=92.02 INCI12191.2:182-1816(-)